MQPRRIDGIYVRTSARPATERTLQDRPRPDMSSYRRQPSYDTPSVVVPVSVPSNSPDEQTVSPAPLSPPISLVAAPMQAKTANRQASRPSKLLSEPIKQKREKPQRGTRRRSTLIIFVSLAILVLLGAGALAYQTWQTNEAVRTRVTAQPSGNPTGAADDDAVPNEAPVTDTAKKDYIVSADMPRYITIDRIGVNARVLRMSVTSRGAVQAPAGIWDTGWYDGSAKPGEPGNAFIDGHISGPTQDAVFVKLKELKSGDKITIERGDGTKLQYAVSSVGTNKLSDIDMKKILAGPPHTIESLTLMTCGGNYQGNYTYDSRVIVIAKRTK